VARAYSNAAGLTCPNVDCRRRHRHDRRRRPRSVVSIADALLTEGHGDSTVRIKTKISSPDVSTML